MMEQDKNPTHDKRKDKYILFAFLGFFGVIFLVNTIFITAALKSHRGEITKKAYEKGLNFNETLKESKNQPVIQDAVSFENKILRWELLNEAGQAIINADVTARIIRTIQEGHDFDVVMVHKGNGVYEAVLNLPFKGLWEAKLSSKWDNNTYKTSHHIIQN